jgi:hypothetical protein
MAHHKNSLTAFSHWVMEQLIQEVAEDSALCEFDCRKVQCTQGEWKSCERRLQYAAGELMPLDGEGRRQQADHMRPPQRVRA